MTKENEQTLYKIFLFTKESKKTIFNYAAGRRQKKKAVVQQTLSMPFYSGGFEQIKAAVLLSSTQNDDALTLAKSAAYGGSRHVQHSISTQSDR